MTLYCNGDGPSALGEFLIYFMSVSHNLEYLMFVTCFGVYFNRCRRQNFSQLPDEEQRCLRTEKIYAKYILNVPVISITYSQQMPPQSRVRLQKDNTTNTSLPSK
jgi:hypothetical protein